MIRVNNIKVYLNEDLTEKTIKKLNIKKEDIISLEIVKESLDARKKDSIHYVYSIDLNLKNEEKVKNYKDVTIPKLEKYTYEITGNKLMNHRPIVVGSGPAGLILSYMLSECGMKPIIIERGQKVEERQKTVEKFWNDNVLNENSNVQFGEGGAGTFSDGKLNTLVKDKNNFMQKVFDIFIENGAPKEIKYSNMPHIGTDILSKVVKNIREKIISNGGEYRFNTCLTDLIIKDNKLVAIKVNNNEEILCDNLFLAIGHSARDTFLMLNKYLEMESKPFSIGIRVMHDQDMINHSQYGDNQLPPASYKLTYKGKEKGVYSFCMCPGGYVVNSSSEKNKLAINGMSYYKRDSKIANSAIVATVDKNDYGDNLFDGMNFQRNLEEKAYNLENGNIPIQNYIDFKNNKKSENLSLKPKIKGNYSLSNINEILPKNTSKEIINAMEYFGTKIKGFNNDNTIIAAIESRTSSPIRILRDENFKSNISNIYPLGEGAGYAGGITTAAMDGLRVFNSVIKEFKGVNNE